MGWKEYHHREPTPEEIRFQKIVSAAKLLELESREPDPDQYYVLHGRRVYAMTVAELSRRSGVSETMLHYFLIGKNTFSPLMMKHLSQFIRMDVNTMRELGKAVKHERLRRFREIDEPCRIPPPLFHYFKPFNRIGPSPNSEKFNSMIKARTGVKRKQKMPSGYRWFEWKAREIAENYGLEPDENGIYRKPEPQEEKPEGVVCRPEANDTSA